MAHFTHAEQEITRQIQELERATPKVWQLDMGQSLAKINAQTIEMARSINEFRSLSARAAEAGDQQVELIQQRTQPITTMLDVCTTNLSQKLTELLMPIPSASQPKLPTIVVKPVQPQKPAPQADNSDKVDYNDRTVTI